MIIRSLLIIAVAGVCLSGCAHVLSREVLQEVNTEITFAELRKAPAAYEGEMVLLGGVIVKAVNREDGTLLEVYQTEINSMGRPINLDISGGRFLAHYKGLLESEIYHKGRKVTLAGIVQGEQAMRLGQIDYRYPLLIIKDIYLWRKEKPYRYEPYPWGYWGPWWWNPWYSWHPAYPWYDRYGSYRCYRQ
jgi:outer membrane lipoprotein